MNVGDFTIEQRDDRLKVVIPIRRNILLLTLFSVSLIVWLAMLGVVIRYLILGLSSSLILTAILLIWLLIWFWSGRFLWKRWQYHASNREILFVDREQLILRRPVSILGLTSGYDIQHVSPLYFSDKHNCVAFDYAYLHVYVGHSLSATSARELIERINHLYFAEDEDE